MRVLSVRAGVLSYCGAIASLTALCLAGSEIAWSSDYIDDESTAPETATDVRRGLDGLDEVPRPRLKPFMRFEQGGPFWRDSQVEFRLRGYDFERDAESQSASRASTLGGEFSFRSGRWRDRLSLAASLYTSYGIDAPEDKDGTGLLGPGQSDLSILGKAFVQVDFGARLLRMYRQDFNIPYINRQDSRMIPNTHEAYTFASIGDKISYIAAHVTGIKRRNSEDFISMAEAAGVAGGNAGTTVAGLRYSPTEGFDIGGMTAWTRDAFNIFYAETNWRRQFNEDRAIQVSGQYTDQRSVGRDRLEKFSTHTWGVRAAVSFRNIMLRLSYTDTDEGAAIRSPFGGRPGYSSAMLLDFDRAGETALRTTMSYHFGRIGMPGLSISYSNANGRHAIDAATGQRLGDSDEQDWTIDYRPEQGALAGLWIRLRTADADIEGPGGDRQDMRIIFNYTLEMF